MDGASDGNDIDEDEESNDDEFEEGLDPMEINSSRSDSASIINETDDESMEELLARRMGLENVRILNERMCQAHEPDDIESEFEVECDNDNIDSEFEV